MMSLCEPLFAKTQLAEQLVEVPRIVSFSSLQRIVEQNVAIPVPGVGGRLAGLQGFLPGQSSRAPTVAQIVDNPAPGGGLQGAPRTEFILIFALSSLFESLVRVELVIFEDDVGMWMRLPSCRWMLLCSDPTGTTWVEGFLGSDTGCGCFFLVAGRQAVQPLGRLSRGHRHFSLRMLLEEMSFL